MTTVPTTSASSSSSVASAASHSLNAVAKPLRSLWLNALARFRTPLGANAEQLDQQRMRDVNAQALSTMDALLLTDLSPVFLSSMERCSCEDEYDEYDRYDAYDEFNTRCLPFIRPPR